MSKKIFILCLIAILFCFKGFSEDNKKFMYDSKGKRDPFLKIKVKDETCKKCGNTLISCKCKNKEESLLEQIKKQGLLPSAIMFGEKKPLILIGDEILGIGDAKDTIIVREIQKEYCVYEYKDQLVEIPFSVIKSD